MGEPAGRNGTQTTAFGIALPHRDNGPLIGGSLTIGSRSQEINAQTGTAYTLTADDFNCLVTLSNASAITLTIPLHASVAFPAGTHIDLIQLGAGKVTVASGGGITVSSNAGNKSLAAQYAGATLVQSATFDTWYLVGSLIA